MGRAQPVVRFQDAVRRLSRIFVGFENLGASGSRCRFDFLASGEHSHHFRLFVRLPVAFGRAIDPTGSCVG